MRLSVRHKEQCQGLFIGYLNGQGPSRKTVYADTGALGFHVYLGLFS
jgi:hypothetical protein